MNYNALMDKTCLKKIVMKQFNDPDEEFQEYFSELKNQLMESIKLKLEVQFNPYLNSVNVPLTSGRNFC